MERVLRDAGLRPKVTVSGTGGERVAECAAYLFNLGTTRLLGLVPDKNMPAERTVRVRFRGDGTVYDVRRKVLVGSGEQFETSIEPAVPCLFAIVAEPVREMSSEGPATATRGEEIRLTFTAAAGAGYRSVAKVEVLDPEGKSISHYCRNEDIVDGRATFLFRTALNDPVGLWRIVVTDVVSGRRATAPVRVLAPDREK